MERHTAACRRRSFLLVILVPVLPLLAAAAPSLPRERQTVPSPLPAGALPPIPLTKADAPVKIDGVLDDPAWEKAARFDIAFEWMPGENSTPPVRTEVLLTYDDAAFYVAFRCFDPEPAAIRAHLMDRDDTDTLIQDDHISFMLDTFNDERRAFQFRVNPLGVRADRTFFFKIGYAWVM